MNNLKKMKEILNIKYPIITSYTQDANMLAILSCYPTTEEWIFNNYVNLWGEEPTFKNGYTMLRFHSWEIKRACPYLEIKTYNKSFFSSDIVEFLISIIDSGKYIDTIYDQFYVPCSERYMKTHFIHDMLIYGYDRERRIFYIGDFMEISKYTFNIVTFECVESAIGNSLDSTIFGCDVIEYKNTNYSFNTYFLCNSLNNLLFSKNVIADNENVIMADVEIEQIKKGLYTFGIKNYSLLRQTLLKIVNGTVEFSDVRPLHVILDHKVMMCERLKYLSKIGLISDDDRIIEEYTNIKYICQTNRSLFIKYTITRNNSLVERIINNLNLVEEIEIKTLTKLIKSLSD